MSTPQDSDALATARSLTGALTGMTDQLKALTAYGKRNRHMIWALAISITLDILLTAVVAITAIQAHDASASSAQTRNATIVSCRQTNVARAENLQLWDYLLSLSSVPRAGGTAAQKAAGEKLLALLHARVAQTFAPRDCDALLKGKP